MVNSIQVLDEGSILDTEARESKIEWTTKKDFMNGAWKVVGRV